MNRRRLGLVSLVVAAGLAGCNGAQPTPGVPTRTPRPPELAGGEGRARVGDFWLETLGDYLGPDYRQAPEAERFDRFGAQLLEYRLREDLLEEHRWALSQQDINAYSDQPNYDASQAYLERVLGAERR